MYAKEPFLDQAIFLSMVSGFGQTGWWWKDSLATARCAEFVDTPGEALEGRNGGDCLEGDVVRVSEEIVDVHVVAGGIHGQGEATSRYWARDCQDQGKGQGWRREPIATIGVWVCVWAVGYLGISGLGITGRASTWRLRGCTGGI
jgi:hypothetical protein